MIQASFFRSLILNSFIFLSVIASHHLAGGDIGESSSILILFLISVLIFWKKPLVEFDGPALASVLIIFQLVGHLVMEQGTEVSSTQMLLGHSIAVVLTYRFAHYLDYLAQNYLQLLLKLLLPIAKDFSIEIQHQNQCINTELKFVQKDSIPSLILGRAPPISLTLNNY